MDVVVVGAGIVGASVAFHLAQRGCSVAVLEAADAPATGSTGRSAAGVRVQFTSDVNVRLSWHSIQEYRAFPERYGHDAGYRDLGYLFLVPEERWPAHLEAVRRQRAAGAPVEVLDAAAAAAMVGCEPSGIAGATFGPADGVIDPHAATTAYLRMARDAGATLHLERPLTSARPARGGGWTVGTPAGPLHADVVVNAAGAWAGEVARRVGLSLPVQPVRRMVFVTSPLPWEHRYPLTVDVASGFYLRSEGRRVLFGRSDPDEPAGFQEGIRWDWLEPTLEAGMARFPWLARASLDRRASWWGYYAVTPDHDAIVGRRPDAGDWIDACGFSGHGVQQAPAVGRLVAEEATEGRATSLDVDALRIDRFGRGAAAREAHIV